MLIAIVMSVVVCRISKNVSVTMHSNVHSVVLIGILLRNVAIDIIGPCAQHIRLRSQVIR